MGETEEKRWPRESRENEGEDLVGEDEKVECPECGKECSGRKGLENHLRQESCNDKKLSQFYFSENQIHEKMTGSYSGTRKPRETEENDVSGPGRRWRG